MFGHFHIDAQIGDKVRALIGIKLSCQNNEAVAFMKIGICYKEFGHWITIQTCLGWSFSEI